ncbi:hypothetical protein JTB14_025579 [Gonioctena quinquepunctata]|nr:hypothetical protein JTB14_025579 [Gonioctena quinquepunctata]
MFDEEHSGTGVQAGKRTQLAPAQGLADDEIHLLTELSDTESRNAFDNRELNSFDIEQLTDDNLGDPTFSLGSVSGNDSHASDADDDPDDPTFPPGADSENDSYSSVSFTEAPDILLRESVINAVSPVQKNESRARNELKIKKPGKKCKEKEQTK